jgi:2-dehydropantoate 2-reductase
MSKPGRPAVLVVGAGAIGGVVAGGLLAAGNSVVTLTTNAVIADALRDRGFRIDGESSRRVAAGDVVSALAPDARPFDLVLLAVQPPQVEDAARTVAPFLSARGRIVCFQNGLCEDRVAKIVGRERVIGAVVAWGASMVGPGRYERTSRGGFTIGTLAGSLDEPTKQTGRMLEAIGPVAFTENLLGARWSKLAINCAISTLGTIGGDRVGVLMRKAFARRLALEIMTEVVHVARAEGVRLEKVAGTIDLDWLALRELNRKRGRRGARERSPGGLHEAPPEIGKRENFIFSETKTPFVSSRLPVKSASGLGLAARHAVLLSAGVRYRKLRSSMLAAIERGRPPAVDFLNGEVVERGDRHGLAANVNRAAAEFVWQIARGERRPSHETLRELYDRTR